MKLTIGPSTESFDVAEEEDAALCSAGGLTYEGGGGQGRGRFMAGCRWLNERTPIFRS